MEGESEGTVGTYGVGGGWGWVMALDIAPDVERVESAAGAGSKRKVPQASARKEARKEGEKRGGMNEGGTVGDSRYLRQGNQSKIDSCTSAHRPPLLIGSS